MKFVIQRAKSGSVSVGGELISEIGKGLVILCGIFKEDTMEHAERAAKKLVNLRLWDDGEKGWMLSAKDQGLEILLVSQFTLYGRLKGSKPDFSHAMKSEFSQKFFHDFVELVKKELGDEKRVKTGKFGHYMDVKIQNDGPCTILYDTNGKESE